MRIAVTQTSLNPDVVKLLQTHAAEVSDMSKRGMEAINERMKKSKNQLKNKSNKYLFNIF